MKTHKLSPTSIKVGLWYIEWRNDGIFAYAMRGPASGLGHQVPAELKDGKPFYPFGIYHTVPLYARKAMDKLVKENAVNE